MTSEAAVSTPPAMSVTPAKRDYYWLRSFVAGGRIQSSVYTLTFRSAMIYSRWKLTLFSTLPHGTSHRNDANKFCARYLMTHGLMLFLCFCLGVAGCCAKTTIAPLDRVKILLQAQNPHYKHLGKTSAGKHVKPTGFHTSVQHEWNFWSFFAGVFSTLRAVPKKEGFLGLYKGNGAMMVRIFPYGAIQFMAFDNYKKVQYVLYCGMTLSKCKVL